MNILMSPGKHVHEFLLAVPLGVKFWGCGVSTRSCSLGDTKQYSKVGAKRGGLLPPAVCAGACYSVSLFHISLISSAF